MNLREFSKGGESKSDKPVSKKQTPVSELENARFELHKAYMLVDTLLRNMPEDK